MESYLNMNKRIIKELFFWQNQKILYKNNKEFVLFEYWEDGLLEYIDYFKNGKFDTCTIV